LFSKTACTPDIGAARALHALISLAHDNSHRSATLIINLRGDQTCSVCDTGTTLNDITQPSATTPDKKRSNSVWILHASQTCLRHLDSDGPVPACHNVIADALFWRSPEEKQDVLPLSHGEHPSRVTREHSCLFPEPHFRHKSIKPLFFKEFKKLAQVLLSLLHNKNKKTMQQPNKNKT